ncbi:hypothetical protein Glove_227g93 [Diversispora epigaea]|uniref:C2 domain-containing protein n=1 Tax=Diversispora epigaea TaxID=1348612 RepID=A0A397IK47_9GLOM|nr:hypothetical protein Glove_227g93 [Diversispora epigaea]
MFLRNFHFNLTKKKNKKMSGYESSGRRISGGTNKRTNEQGSSNVTEDSTYQCALRIAYLAYLTQPKPPKPPPSFAPNPQTVAIKNAEDKKRPNSFIGQEIFSGIFDTKKSLKIPKELSKALRERLEVIVTGRDPNPIYNDPYFRRDISIFHRSLSQQPFRQQIQQIKSGKIEEVVLLYVRSAQNELKSAPMPPNVTWQAKLTDHVSYFIEILKETLQSRDCISSSTPELLARLETLPSNGAGHSNGGTSNGTDDMKMVKLVQSIFQISNSQIQKDINAIKKDCTPQASLEDLRNIINHINLGAAFPARKEDFETEEVYNNWKAIELKTLNELMTTMIILFPGIKVGNPTKDQAQDGAFDSYLKRQRDSVYSSNPSQQYHNNPSQPQYSNNSSQYPPVNYNRNPPPSQQTYPQQTYSPPHQQQSPYNNNTRQVFNPNSTVEPRDSSALIESSNDGGSFIFIPPNPRRFYKLLMNKCIEYELLTGSPGEHSVKILSKSVIELLNECALRWRVSPGFRWLQYLDALKNHFDNEHPAITLDHIKEGMHLLKDATKLRDVSTWTINDRRELVEVFSGIHDSLLKLMAEALEHLFKIKADAFDPIISILYLIYESELFQATYPDITPFYNNLQEIVRKVAVEAYLVKRDQIYSQEDDNEVVKLIILARWIQQETERLTKKFPKSLIGQINVVCLIVEKQVPLLTLDLENATAEISGKVRMTSEEGIPVDDIFELYREISELKIIYESRNTGCVFTLSIEKWFEPHVKMWLEATDSKTPEWVQTAISMDEFKAVSVSDKHSSSVVDLFTSFNQTIDFIKKLNWPNEYQYAKFMTSLSRTVSKALDQYCDEIEELFMKDMFPVEEKEQEVSKQSAWYIRAKTAMASEKAVSFDFKPTTCIKLNNVEAAREQLDKLYETMEVDRLSEVISKIEPDVPEDKQDSYLYTIKIVLAENLSALDSNGYSDPYCVLADEMGNRLVQTRVIYETLNPRWEEAFDITIGSETRQLSAIILDRDQVGSDDVCGKGTFVLDLNRFNDYLAHEVWVDLDTQGRVLLRISMEGEKDIIQFYFGKAFRTLKRSHDDMARTIVDRMSPFLKRCLSRDVINKLLKPATSKTLTNLFKETDKPNKLTDRDIEKAIDPIFDYFDTNLSTLNSHLHPIVFSMVMIRIWKDILSIIEALIIPPLSERPSDMKPLTDNELDVVYNWLTFLRTYLHADGNGMSVDELASTKYHEIQQIRIFYDNTTEGLINEYLRVKMESTASPKKEQKGLNKSVLNQRNLGTIKKRKTEKRKHHNNDNNGELILRILRMRAGTKGFLKQQMEERAKKMAAMTKESIIRREEAPPVPALQNSQLFA